VGQMWLQGGVWEGKQLISKEWIEQMSARQADGGDYGYGFQTWQCAYPSAVRADGALGQYVIVVPEKDVVIVLTEASFTNGKPQRGLIWNKFLPALSDEPLPASEDYEILKKKVSSYQLELPVGKQTNDALLRKVAGKKISVPANRYGWKEIYLAQSFVGMMMTIVKEDGTRYTQPLGYNKWLREKIAGLPPYSINPIDWHVGLEGPFYASGAYGWEKNCFNVNIHYVNWVSSLYMSWDLSKVKKGKVTLTISNNYLKNKVETFDCTIE
ncbi:MAG: serine hydrolase, partial [Bacteroidales bacterium]|nr:serine hydrolase [Bacteroidales bacterium]